MCLTCSFIILSLGIHRSVELIRRPTGADILDYQVQADASGHITCHVECRRPTTGATNYCNVVARLYDDQQLTADGDEWEEGKCVWTASKEISKKNSDNHISFNLSGDIDAADLCLWTAETPHLYTLTLSVETKTVLDEHAPETKVTTVVMQAESCRVGFRTVDIHDGAVHVNGRRITICGMNRHEHCPDNGKVVSVDLMKKDICLLK